MDQPSLKLWRASCGFTRIEARSLGDLHEKPIAKDVEKLGGCSVFAG